MILVTVGTTMPFDELLQEVDRLAGDGFFAGEEVLCQTGQSAYHMRHAAQFKARPTLQPLIEAASAVITHGGATVLQLLLARKRFVAFANPRGAGDHQGFFLAELARHADISWSRNVNDLAPMFAARQNPPTVATTFPRAADVIRAAAAQE